MDNQKEFWGNFRKSISLMIIYMNKTMGTKVSANFNDDKLVFSAKGEYFSADYDFGFLSNTDVIDPEYKGISIKLSNDVKKYLGSEIAETPFYNEMMLVFALNHSFQVSLTEFISQGLTTVGGSQYSLGSGGLSSLLHGEPAGES